MPIGCIVITPPPLYGNPGLNPQRSKQGHQTTKKELKTALAKSTLQNASTAELKSGAAHHTEGGTGASTF